MGWSGGEELQAAEQLIPQLCRRYLSAAVAINQHGKPMALGCALAARSARRAGDVAFLVDEIQETVIALDSIFHQDLRVSLARLGLLAHVAAAVDVIEIVFVVPLQVQLLDFLGHGFPPTTWIRGMPHGDA